MKEIFFRDVLELTEHIKKNYASQLFGYGVDQEVVQNQSGNLKTVKAIKAQVMFRGQTKAYPKLVPKFLRKYPNLNRHSLTKNHSIIDQRNNYKMIMPNPYFEADYFPDYYFMQFKSLEVQVGLENDLTLSQYNIDGMALAQHYGLDTLLLDFSEDIDIAAFFATQKLNNDENGKESWLPYDPAENKNDYGVIFMINKNDFIEKGINVYEIGIQPLARPFAQKGSLMELPLGYSLINDPDLVLFFFKHDYKVNQKVHEQFNAGNDIYPNDTFGNHIIRKLSQKSIPKAIIIEFIKRTHSSMSHNLNYFKDMMRQINVKVY